MGNFRCMVRRVNPAPRGSPKEHPMTQILHLIHFLAMTGMVAIGLLSFIAG
jgi:cytochrome b561